MAGKEKNTAGSEPANSTSQSYFQQAVDESETQGAPGATGEGEEPEGGAPEYGPDHPYFQSQGEEPGGDEGETPPANQPIPDKENPDRYQYWQSIATKQQQQIDAMLAKMNGQPAQGSAPAEPQKTPNEIIQEKTSSLQGLKLPEKPTRPEAYNAQDAYTDPDSASFKYRAAMDEWNDNATEISRQREELRSEIFDLKLKSIEQPLNQMAAKTQLSERNQKTVDYLKEKHQFNDQQAMDFIQTMSKPESMSMENLVEFYRHQKGVTSQQPPTQRGTNRDNRSQPQRREAAPPIPLGSGAGSQSNMDDEAELGMEFGRSLLSFNR